ncbi:MAG TPA: BON domain-containing protein, partial [Bryobacteraceae bacterium]|nr:BON domain-containing protein [Bryobacteraceae bacterium]
MRNALVYILIFLAAVFIASPASPAGAQKAVAKSASHAGSALEIEKNIQAKLAKSRLAPEHFTVSVSGGVATIGGVTDIPQHKGVMTRMAKASGATAVRNNIRVSAAGKAKATETFAKARSKSAGVSAHTGTSSSASAPPQL